MESGMNTGWLVLAACLAASTPLSAAQVYQWKDEQGRTVYSDQPPPASVRNVQQKAMRGSVIEGGESYSSRVAREKSPVTLYASDCGAPCDQARKLLGERGVPFNNKDPQANPEAQAELQKLTGKLSVPVLVVGSDRLNGFEAGQWHGALDRAGYPRSVPVRQPAAAPAPPPAPTE
jgi:glutaredoxin